VRPLHGVIGTFLYPMGSSSKTQVSLLPPPWLLLTIFSVQNVWPQIDAAAFEMILAETGVLAQFDNRLGDEVARIILYFFGES
jgi:hypothetical protein